MKNTSLRNYNCSGLGHELDTLRIQNAIDDCHAAGGGIVFFPPGRYLAGSIEIKSNVTLHFEEGAILEASTDINDYPVLPHLQSIKILFGQGESTCKSSAFLFANQADHIAITGKGIILGHGDSFMSPIEIPEVIDYVPGWHSVPHYWSKPRPRPEAFVNFYECSHVRIDEITLQDSFTWTLAFFLSDHISVRNIRINNQPHLMNADGIDIVDSSHVDISGCQISCADDGICLKNTNWKDPCDMPRRPVEHITIKNCSIKTCCNGFKIGTDSQHGFHHINFDQSSVSSLITSDDPLHYAITGVAIESVDGGHISDISVDGIMMDKVRCPFFLRLGNRGRNADPPLPGSLNNVDLSNISANGCILPGLIAGIENAHIKNIHLSDFNINAYGKNYPYLSVDPVPELENAYPEAVQFGPLPAYGLFCRHAQSIYIHNGGLSCKYSDSRPPLYCEDVQHIFITELITPDKTINITPRETNQSK